MLNVENIAGTDLHLVSQSPADMIMTLMYFHLQETEEAFYLFDVGDVILKYKTWLEKLPRVTPFYGESRAVMTEALNPNPTGTPDFPPTGGGGGEGDGLL